MKLKKLLLPVVMVLVAVFVCVFALPSEADAALSSVIIVPSGFDGVYAADGTFYDGASLIDDVFPNGTYYDGTFKISIRNGATTITGVSVETDGVFIVPDVLGGCSVIAIGEQSFGGCKAKTVILPDTITSIPDFAFMGCGATEIILPNTIKRFGESAFANCKSLAHITIPNSVTLLGWSSFKGCTSLKTVVLSKGMNYIDGCAFSGCTSLQSITIPAEITTIEEEAFYKCEKLTDVFYYGTEGQWNDVFIGESNGSLSQATVHFCDENGVCTDCGARKLAINAQPVNTLTPIGEKTTVTVEAVGDGLTYKWYYKNRNATKFSYTTSFTGNRYWVEMSAARANRQVYCEITDKYGNQVTTDTVTLNLKTVVEITKQPANVSAASGKTAKVSVSAVGDGLTYRWYFKNAGTNTFSLTKTFKGSTYSVKMDATRAGRQVYCIVSDKYGNFAITDVATLNMPVTITQDLTSAVGKNGGKAYVKVKAIGEGLTYKWYFKNKGAKKFSLTKSFTADTYAITMNNTRDGRQVYCVITDKYGNTATTKTVTLNATPTVTPASATAKSGSKVKLKVSAQGNGLTYQWQVKTPSGKWKNTSTPGNKTRVLTVSATKARNGYQYRCVVSDKYGGSAVSSVAKLRVK